MHGRKSLGKSPIGWNIGLSVAAGLPWCGLPTATGGAPVLYIEVDTPSVVVLPRLKALEGDFPRGIPFHLRFFEGGIDILNPSQTVVAALAGDAERIKPALVVVNTLRKVFTASANDSEVPSRVYGAFQRMFPGAALLFVHHDRKLQRDATGEMEREDLSGSLAWANDAQVVLHLLRHGRTPGMIRLDHTGSQASELHAPLILRLDGDGSHLHANMEDTLRQVRLLLAAADITSAREKDRVIAEALGCSERHARTLRMRAEGEGT